MGRNRGGKNQKGKKKKRSPRKNGGGAEDDRNETEGDEYLWGLMEKIDINKPLLSYSIGTRVKCPYLYDAPGYDESIYPWNTGTVEEHLPDGRYSVQMDGTTGVRVSNIERFFEKLDDEPPVETFSMGSRVECQLEEFGRWFPGVVMAPISSKEETYICPWAYRISFDYGRVCDFWGPPAAIRACKLPLPNNRLKKQELRFRVGDRVECSLGPDGYLPGTIIKTWYGGEKIFEDGHRVPYQVQLDRGDKIYAPLDIDQCIRNSSIPPPTCWICFDNEQTEDNFIVHECACRGSQNGFVHIGCLVKWARSRINFDESPDDDLSFLRCATCKLVYPTGSRCHTALIEMIFNQTKHLDIRTRWSKVAITSMSQVLFYEEEYDAAEGLLRERISTIRSRIEDEEKRRGGDVNLSWMIDLSNFFQDLAVLYSHKGSFDEMKEAIEESLRCLEIVTGADDGDEFETCDLKSDLFALLGKHEFQIGNNKSALEYCEKALNLVRESDVREHEDIEDLLWLSGKLNIIAGDRQRGTELLSEVVDYDTKIHGKDSLHTRHLREQMQEILTLSTDIRDEYLQNFHRTCKRKKVVND